ncbi:MAG TPA: lytic transglycosylase domain-containing protein [Acidimicrobiales bacterium]|nr:lytic transglycosylase domain-containing protein [Acidimicrobiales bacterium]
MFAPPHPAKWVPLLKKAEQSAAARLAEAQSLMAGAQQALDSALSAESTAVAEVDALGGEQTVQALELSRARTGLAEVAADSYEAGGPSMPELVYVLDSRTPSDFARREALANIAAQVVVQHAVALRKAQSQTKGAALRAGTDLDESDRALWAARDQLVQAQAELVAAQTAHDQAKASYDLAVSAAPQTGTDVPQIVLAAYQHAANVLSTDPKTKRCGLIWQDLAAIGRIESGHAQHADTQLAANGDTYPPILGPALDGTNGFAALPQPTGVTYDGPGPWERAVGPMQFLPTTWAVVTADGNGDGVADPNNIYDSALGAGIYLCKAAGTASLATTSELSQAFFSYNHDPQYVWEALNNAVYYGAPITLPPAPPPPPAPPTGPQGTTGTTLPPASTTPPPPPAADGTDPGATTTTSAPPGGPTSTTDSTTSTTSTSTTLPGTTTTTTTLPAG